MSSKRNPLRREVGIIAVNLDQGLRALHELGVQSENGITAETLSICVEQMTASMLAQVEVLHKIAGQL